MRSLWRWLEACLEQHLAHRRRRNPGAETLELADDPFVSSVRVLPSETKDQLAERALEWRSPGSPLRVGPAARDQLAVPAKQRRRLDQQDRPGRPGNERLSDASSSRSVRVSFGVEACQRRIASSWRRTRISNSFERRGRPSSHTSANRFRTTRYTNDQSKQPSLDHGRSTEANARDAPESRGRVCEPYGRPLPHLPTTRRPRPARPYPTP